MFQSRGIIH